MTSSLRGQFAARAALLDAVAWITLDELADAADATIVLIATILDEPFHGDPSDVADLNAALVEARSAFDAYAAACQRRIP